MNMVNFLDGIDGLAAGVCAISGATFAVIALSLGQAGRGHPGRDRLRRVPRLPAPQLLPGADLHGRLGRAAARVHARHGGRPGAAEDRRDRGAVLPAARPRRADPRHDLRRRCGGSSTGSRSTTPDQAHLHHRFLRRRLLAAARDAYHLRLVRRRWPRPRSRPASSPSARAETGTSGRRCSPARSGSSRSASRSTSSTSSRSSSSRTRTSEAERAAEEGQLTPRRAPGTPRSTSLKPGARCDAWPAPGMTARSAASSRSSTSHTASKTGECAPLTTRIGKPARRSAASGMRASCDRRSTSSSSAPRCSGGGSSAGIGTDEPTLRRNSSRKNRGVRRLAGPQVLDPGDHRVDRRVAAGDVERRRLDHRQRAHRVGTQRRGEQ